MGDPAAMPAAHAPGLNHFYVVLDEATFQAVRRSPWLAREFAAIDAGLPDFPAPGPDADRLFMRGQHTYIELFGPHNRFREPVGKVGIALGAETLPELDALERRWSARPDARVSRMTVHWTRSDPQVPWYEALHVQATGANPHLVLWAATYRSEFLPWLYPWRSAHRNGTSRADFLAPRYDPDRLLRDVRSLTVAVPQPLRLQVADQLESAGMRRSEQGDTTLLVGPDWSLVLTDADGAGPGLVSIELATNRGADADETDLRFGKSRLATGRDGTATWTMR